MRVTVVLDRAYGGRADHPLEPAFWLVESPENRKLAEQLWSEGTCDPNSAVFKADGYASVGDAAVSTFFNVAEHHPSWTEIEFIGAPLDEAVRGERAAEGAEVVATTAGFLVKRDAP